MDAPARRSHRFERIELAVAAGTVLLLVVWWSATLPAGFGMGWDESMHAALPAARIRVALASGDFAGAHDALQGCAQYPFVWPCVLAIAQALFGASDEVARTAGIVAFGALLVGLFDLVRLFERRIGPRARGAAWIALALAGASPLCVQYAGTLFLEVPFACAAVWTLRAWLRALESESRVGALVAGAWLTLAIFTKWNYGVLLGAGLALDAAARAIAARRTGSTRATVRLAARAALVPALACAWWFFAPLPAGFGVAAEHRAALADFLAGNRQLAPVPYDLRVLYAAAFFAPTPRVALLVILGLASSARSWRDAAVRSTWIVALACAIPVWLHPFHLDRFQIPCGVLLLVPSAIGLATLLPRALGARAAVAVAVAAAAVAFPGRDSTWLAEQLGILEEKPDVRAYQLEQFSRRSALGARRAIPVTSLARTEAAPLLAAIAAELRPGERWAWIGVSSELAPAVVHLELLAASGDRARFSRDAAEPVDVDHSGADPAWSDERLREFADRADVVLFTEPTDLRQRADRSWPRAYVDRLRALGWSERPIATSTIARPMREPLTATLFACRRR